MVNKNQKWLSTLFSIPVAWLGIILLLEANISAADKADQSVRTKMLVDFEDQQSVRLQPAQAEARRVPVEMDVSNPQDVSVRVLLRTI